MKSGREINVQLPLEPQTVVARILPTGADEESAIAAMPTASSDSEIQKPTARRMNSNENTMIEPPTRSILLWLLCLVAWHAAGCTRRELIHECDREHRQTERKRALRH